MPSTTHPGFGPDTEAIEVAQAFSDGICGKTIMVTGVNPSGIGFTTAQAFASQSPACLILAGRTPSKLQDSIKAIQADYPSANCRTLNVDLSSQKSVRAAAAELLSWSDVPKVDMLVNSAGVCLIPERTLTEDGIEMHLATNHVGHFLLTCLIAPKLIAAAQTEGVPRGATRVVNVSAGAPSIGKMRWSDMMFERKNGDLPEDEQPLYAIHKAWGFGDTQDATYVPLDGYVQSKVANLLFSIGANARLLEKHGILSITVHPGVIQTELVRTSPQKTLDALAELFKGGVYKYKSLGAGSATSLVAALDPALVEGFGETKDGKENDGVFLSDCQVDRTSLPQNLSLANADRLWKFSEEAVNETFVY